VGAPHGGLDGTEIPNFVLDERELAVRIAVAQPCDVYPTAWPQQRMQHCHLVPITQETLDEVGPDRFCSANDHQRQLHRPTSLSSPGPTGGLHAVCAHAQ